MSSNLSHKQTTQAILAAMEGLASGVDLAETPIAPHTHTAQGTAQAITGLTSGKWYLIGSLTSWVAAGASKVLAEAGGNMWSGAVMMPVKAASASIWVDTQTAAVVNVIPAGV